MDPLKAAGTGFFGCFGVLAAVVAVVFAAMVWGRVANDRAQGEAEAAWTRLDYRGFCVGSLAQLEARYGLQEVIVAPGRRRPAGPRPAAGPTRGAAR